MRADRVADARGSCDPGQCPAGAGAVHAPPGAGPQDRAGGAPVDGLPDGSQNRDRQRDVGGLGALAEHVQQLVAGLVAQVADVCGTGFRHAQPEHPEQADQRVVVRTGGAGGGEHRGELEGMEHGALSGLPRPPWAGSLPRLGWPR